jgi:hypothetical protein
MYEPEKTQGKNVSVLKNQDFLCLSAQSGRGLLFNDPRVSRKVYSLNESMEVIGNAVFDLLGKSAVLSNEDFQILFKSGDIQKEGEAWERAVFKQFSYKTKGALYKKMLNCTIRELDGVLTFSSTNHSKLTSWSGMSDVEKVIIPATSSSEEVGLALCEAFSRCKSEVA